MPKRSKPFVRKPKRKKVEPPKEPAPKRPRPYAHLETGSETWDFALHRRIHELERRILALTDPENPLSQNADCLLLLDGFRARRFFYECQLYENLPVEAKAHIDSIGPKRAWLRVEVDLCKARFAEDALQGRPYDHCKNSQEVWDMALQRRIDQLDERLARYDVIEHDFCNDERLQKLLPGIVKRRNFFASKLYERLPPEHQAIVDRLSPPGKVWARARSNKMF